ncbi:Rsc9p ASCRUDRAFT_20569, partial [Ascoidea rubescens DSM 1968]
LENSLNSALILRNISQDIESAQILSKNTSLINGCLNLLNNKILLNSLSINNVFNSIFELFVYTLDIIESISSFLCPAPHNDPLFLKLLSLLSSTNDTYFIIIILRSLSRLMVRSNNSKLFAADNITSAILDQIISYLLINTDHNLILTCLDFLYQYILPGGIRINNLLKSNFRFVTLSKILPMLLNYYPKNNKIFTNTFNSLKPFQSTSLKLVQRVNESVPEVAQELPLDLSAKINQLNEPERASQWLKCCFSANPDGEVTQISLWKSYEKEFFPVFQETSKKLLQAVDFIKNVANAFPNSAAMVIPTEKSKRFIIKGIQPR